MSDSFVQNPSAPHSPERFTQAELGWQPWLEPLGLDALEPRHWDGLVDAARAKSPYFMLLAHDPEVLGARTRTDKDIFYNPAAGLPRAERELAATAVSRANGCIYCASVHARFASQYSQQGEAVQRLLDEGTGAALQARWRVLVAAAVALSATPSRFGPAELGALREQGLDDGAILDLINSAAFFNWANRLMLSLGEARLSGAAR